MTKTEIKKRIEKLRDEINRYRYEYHVLDNLKISEAALDSLKHELFRLEQEFPEFITPDSPTQRIGGHPLPRFKKVSHHFPMLSMEDVFTEEELNRWLERAKRFFPRGRYDFFAEVKMDGLAVSLVYEDGFLTVGATRGDGMVGEDVTQNLKTIEAIPLRLRHPTEREIKQYLKNFGEEIDQKKLRSALETLTGRIEVRGETYMTKKIFEELNREQKKKNAPLFANPRNAAAGSIRQLNPEITERRKLSFLGYSLLGDFGLITHEQAHMLMPLLGIPQSVHNQLCKTLDEAQEFYQKIFRIREKLSHWIDGIVVTVNDDRTFERLGRVGKTPRGIIAYKFPAEQVTTRVREVRWQVGRTGVLTPVAVMDSVFIAGTTVRHATIHNMDEIERLGLKTGDTIILEKAGDIIPKIIEVLPKLRTGVEKIIHAPKKCPACDAPVIRRPDEVAILCTNSKCPAKHLERITHFVSKKAFDIEGLGYKIVEQLMNAGLIAVPTDIFTLEKDELVNLERFGEKSADNLIASIDKARSVSLTRFIYALGINHVGDETAAALAEYCGTIQNFITLTKEKLERIPGIGDVVGESIINWLFDEQNLKIISGLLAAGVNIEAVRTPKYRPLKGKILVLTGELESLTRDEAKEKIRYLGGDVSASVSKNTDYVVAGAEPGSKYDKAQKLGIKIINEKEFLKLLK